MKKGLMGLLAAGLLAGLLLSAVVPVLADRQEGDSISGGGQIVEEMGNKHKDWYVISFGGFAGAGADGYAGQWEVNFHNVGGDDLDKTKFHTTEIVWMDFYGEPGDSCVAMRFMATGKWQGNEGYWIDFRAQDAGEPGSGDNARIQLYEGIYPAGTKIYDSNDEFTNISPANCYGSNRTYLDHGNLQLVLAPSPVR